MNAETSAPSRQEIVDEVSKWGVGGGILLTALAPLSLPIVILTVVALLPLVAPLLVLGLLAGLVAVPVMVVRKVSRSLRPPRRRRGQPEPAAGTAGEL
jgi:membrane protein implicated in regulation of membrane protease activity